MAVTRLEADREEVCPGEVVTITATTTPPAGSVFWSVGEGSLNSFGMDNGILAFGQLFDANGNLMLPPGVIAAEGDIIRMRFGRGETRVITATHGEPGTSLSVTITWKEASAEIKLDPSPHDVQYLITAEPKMHPSVITAKAIGIGGSISVEEWNASVGLSRFDDCPPHGPDNLNTVFDLAPAGTGEQITINLTDVIRGGGFSVSVRGTVNGCPVEAFAGSGIRGTNPQQSDIQAALPHDTLRRIACKESGQRQFDAPPNGGSGFCPLFGPGGKVGVMQVEVQVENPTAEEVWNWRANVAKGVQLFNEKVDAAKEYPNRVRDSAGFQDLVEQFNQKRQQAGLALLQEVVLPDFTTGNFDNDLQQLELDAIRGYNGWHDSDRFGFELHEFKVAVDVVNGEEVLRVTNIDEQTLRGKAVWDRVPVEERPQNLGDPDYVNNVLSFLGDCSPAPVTKTCFATLRFLDFENNEIDPNIQALAVSNHVSNDGGLGLPFGFGFDIKATDRKAFRLEVEDPIAGATVQVELQVGGFAPLTYELTSKLGNRYRGSFLRLVTDQEDASSLLMSQNILCKLGDKVRMRYTKRPAIDCEDLHEIQIGRPVGEDNNDHPSHLKHDIRELKLNVVVFSVSGLTSLDGAISASRKTIKVEDLADAHNTGFIKIENEIIRYEARTVGSRTFRRCVRGAEGTVAAAHPNGAEVLYPANIPAATREEVLKDLDNLDERFAQAGIRTKKPVPINMGGQGDPGVVLPPALLDGYIRTAHIYGNSPGELLPTASEIAVTQFKDADVNSIDIFYVDRMFTRERPAELGVAYARPARLNNTTNSIFQNFTVLTPRRKIFTLAHEIMHILLNDEHRIGEPATALFYIESRDNKLVDSTKRIGPYPDANTSGVGSDDTRTIRANAERLPS